MPVKKTARKSVLVVASTYPRWLEDTEPGFVHELTKRLTNEYDMTVLAPAHPGAKQAEIIDDVKIIRYGYFFNSYQTLCYNGGILPNLKKNPAKILLVPFLILGLALATLKAHRRNRFDLIHNHWIITQGFSWLLVSSICGLKTPAILTSHGGDLFSLKGTFFNWLKSRVLRAHEQLYVVNDTMRELAMNLGLAKHRITVLSMGTDLINTFRPPPVSSQRSGIIFVGRLVSKKGVEYLLNAFAEHKKSFQDQTLTIVGDGPLRQHLEYLTNQLNLADSVTFIGAATQQDIKIRLQKARLAVFPFVITDSGDQEGLPVSVLEALGCGCQVLASDLACLKPLEKSAARLTLFTQKDSQALASAIKTALTGESPPSNDNHKLIAQYDWTAITAAYSEKYNEIILKSETSRS